MSQTTPFRGGFFNLLIPMISSETPDKLANIIRDTWPGLYRPIKVPYNIKEGKNKSNTNNNYE